MGVWATKLYEKFHSALYNLGYYCTMTTSRDGETISVSRKDRKPITGNDMTIIEDALTRYFGNSWAFDYSKADSEFNNSYVYYDIW